MSEPSQPLDAQAKKIKRVGIDCTVMKPGVAFRVINKTSTLALAVFTHPSHTCQTNPCMDHVLFKYYTHLTAVKTVFVPFEVSFLLEFVFKPLMSGHMMVLLPLLNLSEYHFSCLIRLTGLLYWCSFPQLHVILYI